MYDKFRAIFKSHISESPDSAIILTYDSKNNDLSSSYHPYSHTDSATDSFKIGQLLRKYLIFYAHSEKEVVDIESDFGIANYDVQLALDRLPNRHGPTNGIYSETFLDLLLRLKYKSIKRASLRVIYRQKSDNQEIKGFDTANLILDGSKKYLFLGQAKLGRKEYCIDSLAKDLKKTDFLYIYDELCFIADRREYILPEVGEELRKLNKLLVSIKNDSPDSRRSSLKAFFDSNNYKIVIPCLLAYKAQDLYGGNLVDKIEGEIQQTIKRLESHQAEIDFCDHEIVFLIFPIKSTENLRAGMAIDA